jgi:membrane-associated phospholipid phosphatase
VLLAAMVTLEGYTRVYLLKHWLTDALGGYVYGGLMLTVFVYAGRALLDDEPVRSTSADTAAKVHVLDAAR